MLVCEIQKSAQCHIDSEMYKLTTYLKDLPLQSVSSKKNLQVVYHSKQRLLSPDACGTTRPCQRTQTCAECHGARVLKLPRGKWGYI